MIYIPHTPEYASEAERLIGQLEAFGVATRAVPYESAGNWEQNTLARSGAVFRDLCRTIRHDSPNWVLDADIEAISNPIEFFSDFLAEADIALCYRSDKKNQSDDFRVSAGVIGWRGSTGHEFFVDWALRCQQWPKTSKNDRVTYACPEQACLTFSERNAINHGAVIKSIPPQYNCLPKDRDAGIVPVLFHNPASRTKRKTIGRQA